MVGSLKHLKTQHIYNLSLSILLMLMIIGNIIRGTYVASDIQKETTLLSYYT